MRRLAAAVATAAFVMTASAQTVTPRRIIRAHGEGLVQARPDVARLGAGVITQSATATEAASRNAEQSAAVIAALRGVLGATADIRTITYSLGPTYHYPPGGGQPQLTGFTANNVVEAVVNDLSIIGRVIDAAIGAGANRIESLRMGLKDEEPSRMQALRQAGQKARQKAEAIAAGLGVRLGAVSGAQEGYSVQPVNRVGDERAALAAATPVEPGTVDIRATVTLELEVLQ
ncbi:MAG TPA: SIMPL domain-containing protein [Bryobacteraceae bacterium]|nr:SIMPL domain-containing protein [Bryobacteraceae bacterium]